MARAKKVKAAPKKAKPAPTPEPEIQHVVEQDHEPAPYIEPERRPVNEGEPITNASLMKNRHIDFASQRIGGDARRMLSSAGERRVTIQNLPAPREHAGQIWWTIDNDYLVYSNGGEWRYLVSDTPA